MSKSLRLGTDKKDPQLDRTTPNGQEVFESVVKLLGGMPRELVREVAVNLLVNLVRQEDKSVSAAASSVDRFAHDAKVLAAEHYDHTGRRRGIFPYDQRVEVPPLREILPGF